MATLLNSTILTNELLRRFKNNLKAANLCEHAYDDKFAKGGQYGKMGSTIDVRDPVRLVAVKARQLSAQTIVDKKKTITIDTQAHAGFLFTGQEMTLNIDQFAKKYLDSAAVALANQVDIDLLTKMYQSCPNIVGTPGTTPDEFLTYLQAGEALDRNCCPESPRFVVISPKMNTAIVDQLKGLLVPSAKIGAQFQSGRMGKDSIGMDWLMDQNVLSHTFGTPGGTAEVRTTVAATQSTLVIEGITATSGDLHLGDVITVEGVFAVNPVSGATLTDLRQLIVTALATADGSGYATLSLYPEINITAPLKTCNAYPVDGAIVNIYGGAGVVSPQGVLAHPEAFQWASVPMEMPKDVSMGKTVTDPDTGISIRMVSQYDITEDYFYTRCDILYGVSAIRPEWACRIAA